MKDGEALVLTNCGVKRALSIAEELIALPSCEDAQRAVANDCNASSILLGAYAQGWLPWGPHMEPLVQQGWAKHVCQSDHVDFAALKCNYDRNPLENFRWTVFEFTNRCAMSCLHCYNSTRGGRNVAIEKDPAVLCKTADSLQSIGLDHFYFIGGEVIQFGDGWLDVTRQIASRRGEPRVGLGRPLSAIVEVVTSGWFLDKKDFMAAGRRYADADALLADLQANGVSHICFSLDGYNAELHDANRARPALFDNILNKGFAAVKRAKMNPRVSVLVRQEWKTLPVFLEFLARLAHLMYDDLDQQAPLDAAITRVFSDPANLLIPFIDIGTGATHHCAPDKRRFTLQKIATEGLARCKAFFRPGPWITIKSNGVLTLCRVLSGDDEGFGNVHRTPDIVQLLNSLQECFTFQIHAKGEIRDYVRFVDPKIFGESFEHQCSARAVVTMIAQRVHDQGIKAADSAALLRINQEVADLTGFGIKQSPQKEAVDW